ncbi:MAG: hypothetical protein ACRDVG_02335 [Jatrophihabitantaceae bacterium]
MGGLRLVGCGSGTLATLRVLGDASASLDAGGCADHIVTCNQTETSPYGRYGSAVKVVKQADGRWSYTGTACVAPAAPAVGIGDVRDRLVRLIPAAALGLAPRGSTLVNIQTVMWVAAPRRQALGPLQLLGHRVDVRLMLDHVSYDYGDGSSGDASGPGRPYDRHADRCRTRLCPGYDGHVYRDTGARTVSATANWTATFTVDGGVAVTIPGTVAGPTADTDVVVRQARGVLVPDPGGS